MSDCFRTNVLMERPPQGDLEHVCLKKVDATAAAKALGWAKYPYTAARGGKGATFLEPYQCLELLRLKEELLSIQPNIIIGLGALASWALTGSHKITKTRGTIADSTLIPGSKILTTYAPGAVQANWQFRVIVDADFRKALKESQFPEIRRPPREIHIAETIQDIHSYVYHHLMDATTIACDIETKAHKWISVISFAPDPTTVLVIPFMKSRGLHHTKHQQSYWKNPADELQAWEWVNRILRTKAEIIGQNFLYDLQYLTPLGIYPTRCTRDTMLAHHAMYPELPKDLGFLGSLYCNEAAWKTLAPKGRQATQGKKDN